MRDEGADATEVYSDTELYFAKKLNGYGMIIVLSNSEKQLDQIYNLQ